MRLLFLLIATTVLWSCSNSDPKQLDLFNELYFELSEGEKVSPISLQAKESYSLLFNNGPIQIPLYKYIEHADYQIFIGLPYDTSVEAIREDRAKKNEGSSTSGANSFYRTFQENKLSCAEYVTKIQEKSTIYVAVMSSSKEVKDLFHEEKIAKRIRK